MFLKALENFRWEFGGAILRELILLLRWSR